MNLVFRGELCFTVNLIDGSWAEHLSQWLYGLQSLKRLQIGLYLQTLLTSHLMITKISFYHSHVISVHLWEPNWLFALRSHSKQTEPSQDSCVIHHFLWLQRYFSLENIKYLTNPSYHLFSPSFQMVFGISYFQSCWTLLFPQSYLNQVTQNSMAPCTCKCFSMTELEGWKEAWDAI